MGNILENLVTAINELKSSVKSDLEEIRQQKIEVQQLQDAIRMSNPTTRYVRDEDTLILSAPNIIIGNVDSTGRLYSGGSNVLIRGNSITNEATGEDGSGIIANHATTIENIAIDPGIDGVEKVVFPNSKIINQAKAITLQTNDEDGCFSVSPLTTPGINIVSDTEINVSALAQNEARKAVIEAKVEELTDASSTYAEAAENYSTQLTEVISQLSDLVGGQGELNDTDTLIATNYEEVYGAQHEKFKELEALLYTFASGYISCLAHEAEAERSITALNATLETLESNTTDFETTGTTASIALKAENIGIISTDGDSNIRENDTAGLFIDVPHLKISSFDADGALITDSSMEVNMQTVDISTANPAYDDTSTRDSGQIPAVGDVTITSKNVTIQAIDNEMSDSTLTESALTSGGTFSVRAETMSLNSTDTDGNASGSLSINALATSISAMNVDKDTRADKEMATGSTLYVQSEKTLVGASDTASLIQLASDSVSIIAKTTAEMQQDGKAVVTLTGGNLTAGGSAVELDGDTTIKGGADIKGEAKAPVVTADSVTASSSLTSPTITDSQGSGSAASATSPSATLSEETIS